jgi:HSP20 family protein
MNAVSQYRPNTIQNALCDFDRYFESFFGDSLMAPAAKIFSRLPAVDIWETENSYFLEMDLPGYDEKNIEVHLDGASLTISSKQEDDRKKKEEGENGIFLLRERRLSSFNRSFKLPENADPEAVNAAFKKGILSLEIKKRPEAQKRTIKINAE